MPMLRWRRRNEPIERWRCGQGGWQLLCALLLRIRLACRAGQIEVDLLWRWRCVELSDTGSDGGQWLHVGYDKVLGLWLLADVLLMFALLTIELYALRLRLRRLQMVIRQLWLLLLRRRLAILMWCFGNHRMNGASLSLER